MTRPTVHIPLTTVELQRGGLVGAARRTAGALAASGRVDVTIDVLGWQPDLERDRAAMVEAGELHPDVRVRHLFDVLDTTSGDGRRLDDVWRPGPTATRVPVTGRRDDWFDDGMPAGRVERRADGSTRLVWALDEVGRDLHRHELDSTGRVVRTTTLDPVSGDPRLQRWWGRDGSCLLTVRHDGRQPRHWGSCVLHGTTPRSFDRTADLYLEAFEVALAEDALPVVLSQFREPENVLARDRLDDVLQRVAHPDLRLVAVLHSNHHVAPFRRGADPKTHWTPLLRDLDRWDAGVVLTEAQRDDLEAEHGVGDRFRVVPHAARTPGRPPAAGRRTDGPKVVVVARITEKKRPDAAVDVILRVRESVPDARLHLYGFGYGDEEEKRFRARLRQPEVAAAVVWHGFSTDVDAIYADADVVISTSATEGFGLAVLEGYASGVPVVAWDIPYGPAEIVRDGVDGWLVPDGDVTTMAARVVDLLRDEELRASAGRAALERAGHFDAGRFADAWVSLVLDVAAAPARPRPPEAPRVRALSLDGDVLELGLDLPAGSPDVTVEATVRGRSASTTAPVEAGRARLALPDARHGDVVDPSVRPVDGAVGDASTGAPVRLEAAATVLRTDLDGWQPYRTVNGKLSLRRVADPPAGRVSRALRRVRS